MAEELLRLESLCKYYTGSQTVAMGLGGVSLSFRRGEFVAVTGESGSGKSTLAHVLGGILPYESGEMFFRGRPTSHFDGSDYERYRRDCVSFISQSYGILPGCTVLENVLSALYLAGMDKSEAAEKAGDILRRVELWDLRKRRAAKLSSGQKQRLSIARALAKPAPILIADEPTGNLDPENSAKVISLLAHAAKERLVILITHEFSEAEGFATRRISLQDGLVAADTVLSPAAEPEGVISSSTAQKRRLGLYAARLQLAGRPVWSSLVLLFFAFTAFAVFAFLGTFIINLDDTSTRYYDDSAFLNGDERRIVISRSDGLDMTAADYSAILANENVEALEPYGYLWDLSYAWKDGVDCTVHYSVKTEGSRDDFERNVVSHVSIHKNAPFMQSVPMLAEGSFLTAGREPENMLEVVAAGDESLVGSTVTVYLTDRKNWSTDAFITLELSVVGVTDYGSGLYFDDELGRAFTDYFTLWDTEFLFIRNPLLSGPDTRVSANTFYRYQKSGSFSWYMADFTVPDEIRDYKNNPDHRVLLMLLTEENGNLSDTVSPCHSSYFNGLFEVSPETFEKLVKTDAGDQVSIRISDYAYVDEVLAALWAEGYIAISPYREGSTKAVPALAAERSQTLSVCAAALAAVLLLQMIVLRALFSVQTESYCLLSNIGLVCADGKKSVYWQMLLFTLLGQLLGFMALLVCRAAGIERIVSMLRYLPWPCLILLSAVHLTAAALAALWCAYAMARRVFPSERKQSDLPMESEVDEQ